MISHPSNPILIGGINPSQMCGWFLFYPHYVNFTMWTLTTKDYITIYHCPKALQILQWHCHRRVRHPRMAQVGNELDLCNGGATSEIHWFCASRTMQDHRGSSRFFVISPSHLESFMRFSPYGSLIRRHDITQIHPPILPTAAFPPKPLQNIHLQSSSCSKFPKNYP